MINTNTLSFDLYNLFLSLLTHLHLLSLVLVLHYILSSILHQRFYFTFLFVFCTAQISMLCPSNYFSTFCSLLFRAIIFQVANRIIFFEFIILFSHLLLPFDPSKSVFELLFFMSVRLCLTLQASSFIRIGAFTGNTTHKVSEF